MSFISIVVICSGCYFFNFFLILFFFIQVFFFNTNFRYCFVEYCISFNNKSFNIPKIRNIVLSSQIWSRCQPGLIQVWDLYLDEDKKSCNISDKINQTNINFRTSNRLISSKLNTSKISLKKVNWCTFYLNFVKLFKREVSEIKRDQFVFCKLGNYRLRSNNRNINKPSSYCGILYSQISEYESLRLNNFLNVYSDIRQKTCSKVCFVNDLMFLRLKVNLTNSLSNRLVGYGSFYTAYRMVRKYYISLLRANFMFNVSERYTNYLIDGILIKDFKRLYEKYINFCELDQKIFWKSYEFLSIFDVSANTSKYRRKDVHGFYVRSISLEKRFVFVLKWLSIFLRSCFNSYNFESCLIPGFTHFFMLPREKSALNKIRLRIYKIKLLQY